MYCVIFFCLKCPLLLLTFKLIYLVMQNIISGLKTVNNIVPNFIHKLEIYLSNLLAENGQYHKEIKDAYSINIFRHEEVLLNCSLIYHLIYDFQ